MAILEEWLKDLPQQFLGLPKFEILIAAFTRQLQELEQVFRDLNEKTGLESAAGQNLDYVGTIIPLTRKEAGILSGNGNAEKVLPDDRYRQLLIYRRLLNTSECTYYDLIAGLQLLWNTSSPIYYREDPAIPAAILLGVETRSESMNFSESAIPRPAGVGFQYRLALLTNLPTAYIGLGVRTQTRQRIRINVAVPSAIAPPELYAGIGVRTQARQHVRVNAMVPSTMEPPNIYMGIGVRTQVLQYVRTIES